MGENSTTLTILLSLRRYTELQCTKETVKGSKSYADIFSLQSTSGPYHGLLLNSVACSPQANYTDRAAAACQRG
jgi:hypothetical protein